MNEGRFQYGKSQRFEDTISIKTQAKICLIQGETDWFIERLKTSLRRQFKLRKGQ